MGRSTLKNINSNIHTNILELTNNRKDGRYMLFTVCNGNAVPVSYHGVYWKRCSCELSRCVMGVLETLFL